MEITIDAGKNIIQQITDIAKSNTIDFDVAALNMIDLGIKMHLASLERDAFDDPSADLNLMLKKIIENNLILRETLGHVFIKDRSSLNAYDEKTAIKIIENAARSFIDGKKENNYF